MYKVMINCRNRLAITTKCITALTKHSVEKPEIYIYDNLTSHKINEHFMYWNLLYQKGIVQQITFNTKQSTFNAFSKAVSCNQFGYNHEQDPNKDSYDFLLFLDNDIIVTPGFDEILKNAWIDIKKNQMKDIKVISQLPGGIKGKKEVKNKIAGLKAMSGTFGGSGLWCVKPNFFREIGYLDVNSLVNLHKKHDQNYWIKLGKSTNGRDYILGLDKKLGIHCGKISGSICNILTKNSKVKGSNVEELIKLDHAEKEIDSMNFDMFYEKIKNDKTLANDW